MVENNVTIIVGSMPVVATFVRVHISQLAIIKILRYKIRCTTGNYSGEDYKPHFRRPELATFGSPNVRNSGSYERTDSTVMATQVVPRTLV